MSGLKRKRGADTDESTIPKVTVLEASSSKTGPVLAHFPSLAPPDDTPAYVYGANVRASNKTKGSTILVSETPKIEYVSTNQDQAASSTGYACQYLIAVHDRKTNTVTFQPAPLYDLTRTVKALKNLEPQAVSQAQRVQARNVLGEAFGTKKAKAAIRAAERNKVDVTAMKDVQDFVVESVRDGTSALPTKEEVVEASLATRLIPTPNTSATTPAEAYPLSSIIPAPELEAISVQPFSAASSAQERRALLPFRHSTWLNHRLTQMFATTETISKSRFWPYARQVQVRPAWSIERTTRCESSTRLFDSPTVTSQTETKLLTYFLTLCLRIDSFSTSISTLAMDLKITPAKLTTYFKSLGCKIQGTGDERRAVLEVPLVFPKPKSLTKRGGK
ncbi:DNA-directed RNA polymerase I subunit A49 [Ceratobasidium sp. AG-Ba]|nr:DNA-directed RNA polymerase I subunit A49 [Ceratobasidium sp. AG-Ba]